MSAEQTFMVVHAIYETNTRLRAYVANMRSRASHSYELGLASRTATWASQPGRELDGVTYSMNHVIALNAKRDLAFSVWVDFTANDYAVMRSVVDSVEIDEGYDEVEVLPPKGVVVQTEEQVAAALRAAVEEIEGLGDFLGRLDPPLPPRKV